MTASFFIGVSCRAQVTKPISLCVDQGSGQPSPGEYIISFDSKQFNSNDLEVTKKIILPGPLEFEEMATTERGIDMVLRFSLSHALSPVDKEKLTHGLRVQLGKLLKLQSIDSVICTQTDYTQTDQQALH
jgi:hypothetical protein